MAKIIIYVLDQTIFEALLWKTKR